MSIGLAGTILIAGLVNDTYGHLAGDAVLAALSATLRGLLRDYDITGRFGGEEFAILLPHTETATATQVTERLRAKLAEITVTTGHGNGAPVPLQVTGSIGVATRSPDLRLPEARTAPRRCR